MAILNNKKGTGFTNISQILGANKGFGGRLGAAVGTGVGNVATGASQAATTGLNKFSTGLQAGKDAAQGVIGQAKQYVPGTQEVQQAGETSDEYAKRLAESTTNFDDLGKQFEKTAYTGPKDIEGLANIRNKIENAGEVGKLAQDRFGQSQLLGTFAANKNRSYNMGQSTLDQLLLGKSAEGQKALQQGVAKTGQLNKFQNLLGGAKTQADTVAKGIMNDKTATRAALVNALSGSGNANSGGIKGIMTQAGAQANDFNKGVLDIQSLLQGQVTPEQYTANKDYYDNLVNNLSQYGIGETGAVANPQFYEGTYLKGGEDLMGRVSNMGDFIQGGSGGKYFKGDQGQAAKNLAKLLGSGGASDLASIDKAISEFDTDRFDESNMAQIKADEDARDVRARSELGQARGILGSLSSQLPDRGQDYVVRPGAGNYDQNMNLLQNYVNLGNTFKNDYGQGINNLGNVNSGTWGSKLEFAANGGALSNNAINNLQNQTNNFTGKQVALQDVLKNMLANQGKYTKGWTA